MSISNREQFLGICRFERPGDLYIPSDVFTAFWPQTLLQWVEQGAPKQIMDDEFRANYFQFNDIYTLDEIKSGTYVVSTDICGFNYKYGVRLIIPPYVEEIVVENEHTITLISEAGQKIKVFKDNPNKMPMFLDYPVRDRASWKELKKRLDPNTPERWPSDWNAYVGEMNSKSGPTALLVGSFFGFLREWMGLERLLYMFHDDPSLVEDMMEQIYYLEMECIKRVTKDLKIDLALFWEDMAFKTGPLISPDMVRKFMMPRYKKIVDMLHSNSIDIVFLDSDGNTNELIPLWLECGINGHWPLECAAGMDAIALRKTYGKNILMAGNLDKRTLIKGKEFIREEVMSKVPFLLESCGYFPSVDHSVPPDVTWENYIYFTNCVREVAGLEKLPD